MNALTQATDKYTAVFSSYIQQFLSWGKWLFFSLLIINLVWLTIWYAFDKQSIAESMSRFIKQFFVISLFYTLMINPSWLLQILQTAKVMGQTITHIPVDPSSLIDQGIGIANKVILPIEKSSLLTAGFGLFVILTVYLVILFVFISIALELALTLIITTALIAISAFFLGFAALGATSQIARQTLDVILGNCVKLLGIYLVVGAGSQSIAGIVALIPTDIVSFDGYVWIVAACVLFWLISKNLPNQLAKIVSGAVQENRGTEAAAIAISAVRTASTALVVAKTLANPVLGVSAAIGKAALSTIQHKAAGGSLSQLGKATLSRISDQFRHVANKSVGGPGLKAKSPEGRSLPLPSISERIYQATQNLKSNSNSHKLGALHEKI